MGEWKRIFGGKKYVLCILLLFLANLALFQYSQMETLRTLREPESNLRGLWREEREEALEQFYERAEGMGDRVDSMLQISIFADEDSFSYKNIKKTIQDFQTIADVKVGMEEDRAVVAFLDYREQHYIAFAIVLLFVLALFDERKSGLWQIVYSCPGGRLCLAVKRMILLLVLSVITAVVLAFSTLVLSFWDYAGYTSVGVSCIRYLGWRGCLICRGNVCVGTALGNPQPKYGDSRFGGCVWRGMRGVPSADTTEPAVPCQILKPVFLAGCHAGIYQIHQFCVGE